MLTTELKDLTARGYWVELVGSGDCWHCWVKNLINFSKVSGRGSTPEEAVAEAVERLPYRSPTESVG